MIALNPEMFSMGVTLPFPPSFSFPQFSLNSRIDSNYAHREGEPSTGPFLANAPTKPVRNGMRNHNNRNCGRIRNTGEICELTRTRE